MHKMSATFIYVWIMLVLFSFSMCQHACSTDHPCKQSFPKVWCVIMLCEYKCAQYYGDNERPAPGDTLVTPNLPVLLLFIWSPFHLQARKLCSLKHKCQHWTWRKSIPFPFSPVLTQSSLFRKWISVKHQELVLTLNAENRRLSVFCI